MTGVFGMSVDSDLFLTLGLFVSLICVPTMMAAWAESHAPRNSVIFFALSIGMVLLAWFTKSGGYDFVGVAKAVVGVFARVL